MSYIGNTQNNQNYVPAVDFFNGNGSTTAFTLSRPVASVAQVQAVINNVPQNPGDAFTVSGSTITFTSAPPSGTNNIYVYYTSPNTQVVQPGQGTVGTVQIADGSVTPTKLSTGYPYWDASGNVGIGTSSPNAKVQIETNGASNPIVTVTASSTSQGFYINPSAGGIGLLGMYTNNGLGFSTNNTERMRIDSSGNLLVGQTGADARLVSNNSSAGMPAGYFYSTNGSFTNDNLRLKTDRAAGGNAFLQLAVFSSSSLVCFIRDNGNLANANNVYGAISDLKLKDNIVDATPKLDKLKQVRVVNYSLKDQPEQKLIGVVAQELEQVFPSMVEESLDRDENGNILDTTTKSVKYSVFVPILIKAIQELNAKVEAQAAEIAALKGAA